MFKTVSVANCMTPAATGWPVVKLPTAQSGSKSLSHDSHHKALLSTSGAGQESMWDLKQKEWSAIVKSPAFFSSDPASIKQWPKLESFQKEGKDKA